MSVSAFDVSLVGRHGGVLAERKIEIRFGDGGMTGARRPCGAVGLWTAWLYGRVAARTENVVAAR